MTRPRRPLTAEERRLWAEIARSVRPFPGRTSPVVDPPEATTAPARAPAATQPGGRSPPARQAPAPPALAPFERRTSRALARGHRKPDGTLDLHGLTQADAHRELLAFLHRARAGGRSLVLVVTGRGDPAGDTGGRGVLRRQVPHWLSLPGLRDLVLGFEEAGPRQGGSGALYVRLRRARHGA